MLYASYVLLLFIYLIESRDPKEAEEAAKDIASSLSSFAYFHQAKAV